jgi:hypothetical protein
LFNFRAQQQSNQRKTFLLLGVMGSLTAFVIYAFALYLGYASIGVIPIAIGISVIGVWGSYYSSDKIVLSMTGAKVIDHNTAPQLFNLVHEITIASGLPMPKVAIVEDDAPNAFATGRDPDHAVIAFTTGILRVMDREQLQGVAAHELAHVANRDTLVSAVAATTAGAIALMSDFLIRMSLFGGGRRDSNGGENPFDIWRELGNVMTENVTVVRDNAKLEQTIGIIDELQNRYAKVSVSDSSGWTNQTLPFTRQLGNMLTLGRIIAKGALHRDESRGAHYKPEFPNRDDDRFQKTTVATFDPSNPRDPEIGYEAVDLSQIKPRARVYTSGSTKPAGSKE